VQNTRRGSASTCTHDRIIIYLSEKSKNDYIVVVIIRPCVRYTFVRRLYIGLGARLLWRLSTSTRTRNSRSGIVLYPILLLLLFLLLFTTSEYIHWSPPNPEPCTSDIIIYARVTIIIPKRVRMISVIIIITINTIRSISSWRNIFAIKKSVAVMTGGVFYYYMYVCAVARILSCSPAGLQDGQHFISSLLERFKEGSKPPSHYTPGKTTRDFGIIVAVIILFPRGPDTCRCLVTE